MFCYCFLLLFIICYFLIVPKALYISSSFLLFMIARLSASKAAILLVDDEGFTFVTSVEYMKGLIEGRSPHGFIQFKRLPSKTASNRYKPSPLVGSEGVDPFSPEERAKRDKVVPMGDTDEW